MSNFLQQKTLFSQNTRKTGGLPEILLKHQGKPGQEDLDLGQLLKGAAIHQEGKMLLHVCFVGSGVLAAGTIFRENIAYFVELLRRMV